MYHSAWYDCLFLITIKSTLQYLDLHYFRYNAITYAINNTDAYITYSTIQ